ncbi:multidrug effflux MFS transporter [Actinomadura rugatobispora]|uniref:Multidrug effflux MFS transporter n=1 Tax=Actinomadura rugatobispora TaxID=1994 RepID=A0ABW0ZUX9_9ACTN
MIFILGALTAVAPLSIDMYLPALPQLTEDLSTDAVRTQLTLTACVVGLAVGQAIAGPLSDAFGRRRPLLIGVAAYAVASLLCALAPTVETLIALRLVQGATGAAGIVIARAIVRDRYDGAAAARFFSTLMLVNGLAPILAPVLGGQLLRVTPWPGVFAVLSGIGVALFLAALAGLPETLPAGSRAGGGVRATLATFRGLLADRVFAGYALALGLSFASMFVYISGSPFVLQDLYGLSPQAFSLAFGINAVGIVAAGQVGGRLAGRVPLRRLLGCGVAVAAAAAAALLAAVLAGAGLAIVLPALFLVVAAQGMVLPNATALGLTGRPPRVAGSASALLGVAQFAIGGAAAPLAGLGGTGTAVPMAAAIAALVAGAALAAGIVARPATVASQD